MTVNDPNQNPNGGAPDGGGAPQNGAPNGGAPITPPVAGGTPNSNPSIVDYLGSIGHASDYGTRSGLAQQAGIENYSGTAEQNTQLLGWARGNLGGNNQPKPTVTPPVTNPSSPMPSSQLANTMNGASPSSIVSGATGSPTTSTASSGYVNYQYKSIAGAADSFTNQAKQLKQEGDIAAKSATDVLNTADPLAGLYSKAQTDKEIATYNAAAQTLNDINAKIANVQEATAASVAFYNTGTGPALAQSGETDVIQRNATLQISALTALATQIQGNIDAVKGIIDAGISAATANEKRIMDATGVLQQMHDTGLVSLNSAEVSTNNNIRDNAEKRIQDYNDNGDNFLTYMQQYTPEVLNGAGINASMNPAQQLEAIQNYILKNNIANPYNSSGSPTGIVDSNGNVNGVSIGSPTPGVGTVILAGTLAAKVGKGKAIPGGAAAAIQRSGAVISNDRNLDPIVQTGSLTMQHIADLLSSGSSFDDKLGKFENDPKMKSLPGLFGVNKLGTNVTKDFTNSTGGITSLTFNTKGQNLKGYLKDTINAMALSTNTSATQFSQTFQTQLYFNAAAKANASISKGNGTADKAALVDYYTKNPTAYPLVKTYLATNDGASYADALAAIKSYSVQNNSSFSPDDISWDGGSTSRFNTHGGFVVGSHQLNSHGGFVVQ